MRKGRKTWSRKASCPDYKAAFEQESVSVLSKLFTRYRMEIAYVFWGGVTTLVNIVVFGACTYFGMPEMPANILAWLLSVIVAYVSNRIRVFKSGRSDRKGIAREFMSFVSCRIGTGLLDQFIVFAGIDCMGNTYIPSDRIFLWGMIVKVVSNIVVIVLNYVLSRRVIFSGPTGDGMDKG